MKFYLDTSVFGGIFDREFEYDTAKFFKYVEEIKAEIIWGAVTIGNAKPGKSLAKTINYL